MTSNSEEPSHHSPGAGFKNPWPNSTPSGTPLRLLRWHWQRFRHGIPPAPSPHSLPVATARIASPARHDELRVTWLGQSGFLLQISGINVLLDPVLSKRASPFRSFGPARLVAAPVSVGRLPEIAAVVLSHDHYDHLDAPTLERLAQRFGRKLTFFAALGYEPLLKKLGAQRVIESDWWQDTALEGSALRLTCLPAQHWTRRAFDMGKRLWCSWLLRTGDFSLYFSGDSGYCPAFREIRQRVGSPEVALLPIGAYEPRWFMKPAHMNPEEAVQSYIDLGAREFVAMHWGTFRLTDEPMLEPPVRTREEWSRRGLDLANLHIPAHGETLIWRAKTRSTT